MKQINYLEPRIIEKDLGAYNGVLWECANCGFKTRLYFKDKSCPNCNSKKIKGY